MAARLVGKELGRRKLWWMETITAARQHARGVKGYCEEHKISPQVLYQWLRRLQEENPEWKLPPSKQASQLRRAFVPVRLVEKTEVAVSSKRTIEIRLKSGHVILLPDTVDGAVLVQAIVGLGTSKC
jgi:transposase-like protein